LWPTPRANENDQGDANRQRIAEAGSSWLGQNRGATLTTMALMFPTPVAKDDGKSFEGHMAMKGRMGRNTCSSLAVMARSGMWPTPRAMDGEKGSRNPTPGAFRNVAKRGGNLAETVQVWPTPTGRDWKSSSHGNQGNARPLSEMVGGALNPTWVEWLMGLPLGWTDLGASATRSSHRSPKP
jgi:hypothetical protein